MQRNLHAITGLGLAILAALAAGCGQPGGLTSAQLKRAGVVSAKSTYRQTFLPRPMVRPLVNHAGLEDDDAPAAEPKPAAPTGGRAPLPKPTPIPGYKPPAGPGEPDDVDELHAILAAFGYEKTRRDMEATIRRSTHAYPADNAVTPDGWEPGVPGATPGLPWLVEKADPAVHWKWWESTFGDDVGTLDQYKTASLQLAQHKFDVVYYIWISKQSNPKANQQNKSSSPFVNFNEELPVVKGIEGDPWLVQINDRGNIADFLKIPPKYLRDYNHLVEIPRSLYF